jgi:hypothetical protein
MSDMSEPGDPQDQAEALDTDKVPGGYDDPLIEPEYPLDELMGADDYGVTAAEERVDEPLEERLERESPDPLAEELDARVAEEDRHDRPGSLETALDTVEADFDQETLDAVNHLQTPVGMDVPSEEEPVGRIYESSLTDDVTSFIDEEAEAVGSAAEADDLSAEEAAMHTTADPEMGTLDGGYMDR